MKDYNLIAPKTFSGSFKIIMKLPWIGHLSSGLCGQISNEKEIQYNISLL